MSDKKIGNLTVSELKALIKECLREFAEEKLRLAAIFPNAEEQYKALWIKKQATETGFKCNG